VLTNGADTGLRQIEAGLAWHYKQCQNEQDARDRARYANVEIEAREAQRGLWALQGCPLGNGVTAARNRLKPHPLSARARGGNIVYC
jgi:endonuclease YncB( thermonuclease family)